MPDVPLTKAELWLAAIEGVRRRLYHLCRETPGRYGLDKGVEDLWQKDVCGALAEIAVAKTTGRFWHPESEGRRVDVGTRLQVRWRPAHHLDLPVHPPPGDDPDHFFVLVTGDPAGAPPTLRVHGWIPGALAQDPRYWHDRYQAGRPAFWIPAVRLLALDTLPPDA